MSGDECESVCSVCRSAVNRNFVSCTACEAKQHFGKCSGVSSQSAAKAVADTYRCPDCLLNSAIIDTDLIDENEKQENSGQIRNSPTPSTSVVYKRTEQEPPHVVAKGTNDDEQLDLLSYKELLLIAKTCEDNLKNFKEAFVAAKAQLTLITNGINDTNLKLGSIVRVLKGKCVEKPAEKAKELNELPRKKLNSGKSKPEKGAPGVQQKVMERSGDRARRRPPVILGNSQGNDDAPFVAGPPPVQKKRIFISNIVRGPDVTPDTIANYVKNKTTLDVKVFQTNHSEALRLSFVIEVTEDGYSEIMNASLWPENTHIRDFFGAVHRFKKPPGGTF